MTDNKGLDLFLKVSIDAESRFPLVGYTYIDASERVLHIGQLYTSYTFSHLTNLLALKPISTLTFVLDSANIHSFTIDRIKALLNSLIPSSPSLTELNASVISRRAGITKELERLAKNVTDIDSIKDCLDGLVTAGVAIRHRGLLYNTDGQGQWSICPLHLKEFMVIDLNAAAALNLFPVEGDAERRMCLFGLLDVGCTAMSSRLLRVWLRHPLTSLPVIQRRQRLLSMFIGSDQLRVSIRDRHLFRLPDLQNLLRLLVTNKAKLKDIVQLWQALEKLSAMVNEFEVYEGEWKDDLKAEFTQKLRASTNHFKPISVLLALLIDMDALSAKGVYVVNEGHPDLQPLVAKRDGAVKAVRAERAQAEQDFGLHRRISIRPRGEKSGELVMRVHPSDKQIVRRVPGYKILSTSTEWVMFTSVSFSRAAEDYTKVEAELDKEKEKLVSNTLVVIATFAPDLETLIFAVAELDLFCAWAHVCVHAPIPYEMPIVTEAEDGWIDMRKARHPCMEVMDGVHFVANDVLLERGRSRLQIITGPNMSAGTLTSARPLTPSLRHCVLCADLCLLRVCCVCRGGKSTYIRMTGVVQLLAQIGMRVPCESARVSICDRILTRVGAGDSALKGLSTFMKEMTEATYILSNATPNSLIIIDELGRGTSTCDGYGLARAITEQLAVKVKGFCLISTHFHEMTDMEATTDRPTGIKGVGNQHVVVVPLHDGDVMMTHQVTGGPTDKSYGVNVAKLVGMPQELVMTARRMTDEIDEWVKRGAQLRLAGVEVDGRDGVGEQAMQLTEAEQVEMEKLLGMSVDAPTNEEVVELSQSLMDKLANF
jgi:DNA mismatch repair protein MSH2